ncbi:uncharacterized protein LOC130623054 [Hydractinia symbiolongicarpus]|uniref:uncharacterized protein LOC130623054 n=1 Tax=Hydractinia symbiolongicarpus TaxID=13093 RepID=UPI00255041D7|nr:uncharacterized protein LOC130623054 [Hydractinia symbiolongicarpus]
MMKERRKSYTCHFKLKVVDYAEQKKSNGKAAEYYHVHRRRVQEWRNQKHKLIEQINLLKGDTKRLSGGGRKIDPNILGLHALKEKLSPSIRERLAAGVKVTANDIYAEGITFNNKVSHQWAEKLIHKIKTEMKSTEQTLLDMPQRSNARKRDHILRALKTKTYSIHDWLDGNTSEHT